MISDIDLTFYRRQGHLTLNGVFVPAEMNAVTQDIEQWSESFLGDLPAEQRAWYIDGGVTSKAVLRKLDNPHAHRDAVRSLAATIASMATARRFLGDGCRPSNAPGRRRPEAGVTTTPILAPPTSKAMVEQWVALDARRFRSLRLPAHRDAVRSLASDRRLVASGTNASSAPACRRRRSSRCVSLASDRRLVATVERFVGAGVSVYFSQVFFKPPEGGGPKPAHQDNFYFGPTDLEGVVTAWVALDDATLENGCLYFGDGTNLGPVYEHEAPVGEPYNLQLPAAILDRQPMMPAPVRKGGVSFHHGNTFHQSGPNQSTKWRRACALHYVRNDVEFATPALPYDHSLKFRVSEAG